MFAAWRRRRNEGLLGIETSPEGVAIAYVTTHANHRQKLRFCEFLSNEMINDPQQEEGISQALKSKIQELGLERSKVNWVLPHAEYNLLLVESPNVPLEEMREAIRWRIKDLIPMAVEEAAIDVFPLPEDGTRSGAKMVYAVVTPKTQVRRVIDTVGNSQLKLSSIDIAEMSLRNVAEAIEDSGRGLAIVRMRQGRGSLALVRDAKLYLSRQFDLPYNGGLFDELPIDNIVLELQRSLDYYERQMGQVPPTHVVLCGDNVSADKVTDAMANSFPAKPLCLNPHRVLHGTDSVDDNILGLCIGAIGGAMRRLKVA